ncbi:hypothetical protein Ahy_B09g098946 isoform E [Arachis hypogaea]|uniref:Uncharacterized protein n=1 Tax=Arachis hypogaea TaxID=3818 RepID=A0A444XSM5_ARAHY|nr:hypothetical protein Ahy_B09g098946 isoform E [Arachis hypogaea]
MTSLNSLLFVQCWKLFEECFERRWHRTAAYYILRNSYPPSSISLLLIATLDESLYELAGELVFLWVM